MGCGDSRKVLGEAELPSCDVLGRLAVESDSDDCRLLGGRGDLGGSVSGRMTAEAMGLRMG